VIKAFNNILADSLATRGAPPGTPGRICLSVAGDDVSAKAKVLRLIDALGFDGINAGTLADSWRQQPGTPAYCRDLDVNGLKAALAIADASQLATYRAQADEVARAYFAAHTAASSDCRVGDDDLAFGHHGGQVAITQPIGDVPPNAQFDDLSWKMTSPVDRVALDSLGHLPPIEKARILDANRRCNKTQ
jgi:hypothetical protein